MQGTTVKCLAFYDTPFWRKGAQGGSVISLVRVTGGRGRRAGEGCGSEQWLAALCTPSQPATLPPCHCCNSCLPPGHQAGRSHVRGL